MKKIILSTLAALTVAGFSYAPALAAEGMFMGDAMYGPMDKWIGADGGMPITLQDGSTLFLFGDTFVGPNNGVTMPDSFAFVNSSAIHVDGDKVSYMYDLIPPTDEGTFYWINDMKIESDGSAFVVASEFIKTGNGIWGFKWVDADAFWVEDPTELGDWRGAMKLESGWWDANGDTHFIDNHDNPDEVVVFRDKVSYLMNVKTGQTWEIGVPSVNIAVPVKHNGAWYVAGTEWPLYFNQVTTLYVSESGTGPWTPIQKWEHDNSSLTYLSQAHVIDGELVVNWSHNVEDLSTATSLVDIRPEYITVNV